MMTLHDDQFFESWLRRLSSWVALHPVTGSRQSHELAAELVAELSALGFIMSLHPSEEGPLIVGHRAGKGRATIGMYGHYDVVPGPDRALRLTDERVCGTGAADNLGPLALRLEVLRAVGERPSLIWVIEPGEETGSRSVAELDLNSLPAVVDLWLDETGYFDRDGTQRLLSVGSSPVLLAARAVVETSARRAGRSTRQEHTRLTRVGANARESMERLFGTVPYLSIGPNDDRSGVHGKGESLSCSNVILSARQFAELLRWAAGEDQP